VQGIEYFLVGRDFFEPHVQKEISNAFNRCFSFYKNSIFEDKEELFLKVYHKLYEVLPTYDDRLGHIRGFLYAIVRGEVYKSFKKFERLCSSDVYEVPEGWEEFGGDGMMAVRFSVLSFCEEAWGLGVYIDGAALYLQYLLGLESPVLKVFIFWHLKFGGCLS